MRELTWPEVLRLNLFLVILGTIANLICLGPVITTLLTQGKILWGFVALALFLDFVLFGQAIRYTKREKARCLNPRCNSIVDKTNQLCRYCGRQLKK